MLLIVKAIIYLREAFQEDVNTIAVIDKPSQSLKRYKQMLHMFTQFI